MRAQREPRHWCAPGWGGLIAGRALEMNRAGGPSRWHGRRGRCSMGLHSHTNCAGMEIAEALGLNYVFFTEFEELRSPVRPPELQARPGSCRA